VRDGVVTVRPIAGTMPRGDTPHEDKAYEERLLADPVRRIEMAEQNFAVALRMTMQEVVSSYVYSFSRALALSRRGQRNKQVLAGTYLDIAIAPHRARAGI